MQLSVHVPVFFSLKPICISLPRLSIPNMEDLKRRILKIVSNCNKPKVKTTQNTSICVWVTVTGSNAFFFYVGICHSTASSFRDCGTSCLEGIQMTFQLKWTTGGRRCLVSHCWERSRCSFAILHPIRAWARMTRLHTQLYTYHCSCLDVFSILQKMGRRAGAYAQHTVYSKLLIMCIPR